MENSIVNQEESNKLIVNQASIKYLNETRKWTYFLSIMGFLMIGFLVIIAFFVGVIFSLIPIPNMPFPFPFYLISIIYLVMAFIYFFPVYYLYQFSIKIKYALSQNADDLLETAFKFLKSHYKFMGILTIVLLALYPIIIIIAIVAGSMLNTNPYI